MKKMPRLGEQEMEILKYVNECAPVAVRDVAEHFEKSKGLARTTVLTVMERLRKKGFLTRSQVDGVFKYSAKFETGDVLSSKVSDFVEKTLGGSMSPLLSYFLSSDKLSDEEINQLKTLAAKLDQKGG
ncbi:methicillin resistance protein [Bdellovibrio bacteriovorus]|uniref:Methicillin resistance protein n=1 Tax=Bdellovibrio bacteriovorus TaxID=959 RepID=A0A150WHH4_BDEBC|nr:BlaI/MecI/CopY family transcriptional regulator [Bdellovibrio bacteriovorus]KYG62430.1 methicillin resistance protein [Bdellovibrio bacteriovorus]